MNSTKFPIVFGILVLYLHGVATRKQGINDFLHRSRSIWARSIRNKSYAETGLVLHNQLREDHNTPPFKMDAELGAAAQATAEALVVADDFEGLKFFGERRGKGLKFSQNVFNISDEWLSKRPGIAVLWAISGWYDPVNDYDHQNPTPSSFTRLIWKGSTDFGIGIATNGKNMVIVANYAPPSEEVVTPENVKLFQENVLPERKPEAKSFGSST